jgi:SAM-dependent methyltransferase
MTPTMNDDTITAWNTVLFDKWIRFRHLFTDGLAAHGEALLERVPPAPGSAVLDVGCGFGDTTVRLARVVGPLGHAVGVDAAARFVEDAAKHARAERVRNASHRVADVQVDDLGGPYDYAFSRFGTMFFQNPVLAFRNVASAMRPGGTLAMVVWRKREANPWLHEAEHVVRQFLEEPQQIDQPTCGPGPFSLSDADFVTTVLGYAGFDRVTLERFDHPIPIGRDTDEAVQFAMNLGPAGEIIRLCGSHAERMRPTLEAAVRERLDTLPRDPSGMVLAGSSVWLVTATRP